MSSKYLQIDFLRSFLAVIDTDSMTAAAQQVTRPHIEILSVTMITSNSTDKIDPLG